MNGMKINAKCASNSTQVFASQLINAFYRNKKPRLFIKMILFIAW